MANERRNRSSSSTTTLAKNNLQILTSAVPNFQSPQSTTQLKSFRATETDISHVDPDSLFVKHTISEIKVIQAKLKTEADAKQEELRLMVGERYRDLLQASTSIMYMAESSRRVVDALHQMRHTTSSVLQENKPPRVATKGQEDDYLKSLQSLSAHLKVLLDAPESLWRFLEKKEYLNATWLFLLSRVVHRALTNENLEEVPWVNAGINVQTQFPIAQRQWELISQFRSQIAHRATQSLKEGSISSATACTTLLGLHLLNSSPLTETLSTFLSQRSKTLTSLLGGQLPAKSATSEEKPKDPSKREASVNDLQKSVLNVIDIICGTIHIARDVFQAAENSGCSMIEESLENFQSNDPSKALITTSSLLASLPSSAHLSTLPRTILTYKPYIDLTSPSTHVDPSVLDSKLSSWFEKVLQDLNGRIQSWLGDLLTISDLWSTRKRILDTLQAAHGLKELERTGLQNVVDSGVRTRVIQLINLALDNLEKSMQRNLQKILQVIKENNIWDTNPSSFMFTPPQLPSVDTSSKSPLSRYKTNIRRRIEGRTPLMEDIQQDMDSQASLIRADLDIIRGSKDKAEALQQQVMESYEDSLLSSSSRLSESLETFVKEGLATDDFHYHKLDAVLSRLCYHLLRSQFLREFQCASLSDQGLSHTLGRLQEQCINSWQNRTVLKAVHEYQDMFKVSPYVDQSYSSLPTQPSNCLMNALMLINYSLNELGLPKREIAAKRVTGKLLASFGSAIADKISLENPTPFRMHLQIMWDMTFFSRLQSESKEEHKLLMEKLAALRKKLESVLDDRALDIASHFDQSTSAYLLRSQTLFGPLINRPLTHAQNGTTLEKSKSSSKAKTTSLLRFGTPDIGQDYLPAIELAKPSSRFAMLLISAENP